MDGGGCRSWPVGWLLYITLCTSRERVCASCPSPQVYFAVKLLERLGQHKTARRLKYGHMAWEIQNSAKTDRWVYVAVYIPVRHCGGAAVSMLVSRTDHHSSNSASHMHAHLSLMPCCCCHWFQECVFCQQESQAPGSPPGCRRLRWGPRTAGCSVGCCCIAARRRLVRPISLYVTTSAACGAQNLRVQAYGVAAGCVRLQWCCCT